MKHFIKLAITGAQSTGKSTLIDSLKQDPDVRSLFEFTVSPTRLVSENNNINEDGDDVTQLRIAAYHINNFAQQNNIILDRCALDGYVYTSYLFNHKKVSRETLEIAESIFMNLAWQYDAICYIPPEIDIIEDGVRSTDRTFRDEIVELFDDYINVYKLPVAHITGTVVERTKKIKMIIGKLTTSRDQVEGVENKLKSILDEQINNVKKELS
jgi:nicotinamide riboside kinase